MEGVLPKIIFGLLSLAVRPLEMLYNIVYTILNAILLRPLLSILWASKVVFFDVPYQVLSALSPGLIFLTVAAVTGLLLGGVAGVLSEGITQVLCGPSAPHVAADAEDSAGYYDEEDLEPAFDGEEEEEVVDDEPPAPPERFMTHANFYMDESWDSSEDSTADEDLPQGGGLELRGEEEEETELRSVPPSVTQTAYATEVSSTGIGELEVLSPFPRPVSPAVAVSTLSSARPPGGRNSPADASARPRRRRGNRPGFDPSSVADSIQLSPGGKARALEKGREAARRRAAMQRTLYRVGDRDAEPAFGGAAPAALLKSPRPVVFSTQPNGRPPDLHPADALAAASALRSLASVTREARRSEGSQHSPSSRRSHPYRQQRHPPAITSVPAEYWRTTRFSMLRKRDRRSDDQRRLAAPRPPRSSVSSGSTISSVFSSINSSTIGRGVRGVTAALGSRMAGVGGGASKCPKKKDCVVEVGAEL